MNDNQIVELYLKRDEKAVAETMSKYNKYLQVIANKQLYNLADAEECINDTYNYAWKSIPPNEPENLATYLGKLLRRSILMKFRRDTASKRIRDEVISSINELEEFLPDGKDFTGELEAKELGSAISSFLRGRKETERNVFIRRYYYYDDIKTISGALGYSESKVKMMLKRTRDALADTLQKEGYII